VESGREVRPEVPATASNVRLVVTHTHRHGPGLRERKKLKTRSCLIEAALTVAERQGYESTTVEQIADTAEVSARTFARYFPTKSGVFESLLHEVTVAANVELERVPADVPPLRALRAAQLAMLRGSPETPGRLSPHRLVRLLHVLSNSPSLRLMAVQVRTRDTTRAIARRLDKPIHDRPVRLTAEIWATVVGDALEGLAEKPFPAADDVWAITEFERLVVANFDALIAIAAELHEEPH